MKVMKFGGTSVGTPDRMKEVTNLVTKSGEPVFVVLSAMSGTTNSLVEIADYLYKKNPEGANEVINQLERKYMKHVDELYKTDAVKEQTREFLISEMNYLRSFTKELFTSFEEKSIVAQGEMMSTNMVVNYMQEQGIKAVLLNALDFMRTDKNSEPDPVYIKEKLAAIMEKNEGNQVYITQGFICRNAYGEIDNLQRGGSDYTASLIGAALNAEEIQIWTDIDGMHNNDPRVVDKTTSRRLLSWLTSVLRFCTPPAFSLPSMLASLFVCSIPCSPMLRVLPSLTRRSMARSRPLPLRTISSPSRLSRAACCWPLVSCARSSRFSSLIRHLSTWYVPLRSAYLCLSTTQPTWVRSLTS